MPHYAGLEMGGTKTIAVLGRPGEILEHVEWPTTSPGETLERARAELSRWQGSQQLAGLGIAAFGPVRLARDADDYGTMLDTPKPGWRGTDLVASLSPAFSGPIALDTDVNAAALAEYHLGAGIGCRSLIYLTIGTGVGGGILVEGRPVHGILHPEIGHMRLRRALQDRFAGSCPYHGDCVEGLVSGTALTARFGGSPAEVAPDDPRWDLVASDLAELLANLMLALSPERIIVGGGVAMRRPHLLQRAIGLVPERLAGYLGPLDAADLEHRVVLPHLGNAAGPHGSLFLAAGAIA